MTLRPVDRLNRDELLALRVSEAQSGLIESVSQCLGEADDEHRWRPVGLYNRDTPVGFAMYGAFDGEVWLDRLMIDQKYQGRGYGKEALEMLLHLLQESYKPEKVYLSVYDNNPVAIHLYESFGFRFNGALDSKGERVMEWLAR